MPLREFKDEAGRPWQAWDTYPAGNTSGRGSALGRYMAQQPENAGVQPTSVRQRFEAGWLTFQSGKERRRLVPIPTDWEDADEATLRRYLENSENAGNESD